MLDQQEKLWDFDAVEPGQVGNETVVEITAENIAEYARVALNPDPRYQPDASGLVAMPTMVLSYAPLLREEIAEANGFVAFEVSKTARRQTPFAKCEVRWFHPVVPGDTITGRRRVLEKYERRGSKFVTFRVEAINQRGENAAEYDYTCIFEYAKGQREAPSPNAPSNENSPQPDAAETPQTGRSKLLDFGAASIGDTLPEIAITESQEIINRKNDFRLAGRPSESNIHTDEEFAKQNIFAGTTNSGPATMSYVDQMLELSFSLGSFYSGGSLLMRAITPFRSGDTVNFQGEITGKSEEAGKRVLECRIKGINQRGELVCLSDAVFPFE
ncbi:MAG: MaoC family dehydratase N-terminal domain-containing protein [Chloroflexi bacterium]|nr:MaoC family dehydratase N-terminal domain-containing protein [Chloroflexota bacterium]